MTNAGTARDKSHHYDGAQRAYVDAANLLSASSSLTTTTTTSNEPEGLGLVLERQRMLGLVRRQASLSMRHHVHQTFKRGCYKMKGVWKDRDYNTAILLLDEAVEAGEIYYSSLVSWKMMVKKFFFFFSFEIHNNLFTLVKNILFFIYMYADFIENNSFLFFIFFIF